MNADPNPCFVSPFTGVMGMFSLWDFSVFFSRNFLNMICRLLQYYDYDWTQEDGQSQQGAAFWGQMLHYWYGPYASGIFEETFTEYPTRIVKQIRMVPYLLLLPK